MPRIGWPRFAVTALVALLIACTPQTPTYTLTYDGNGGSGTAPTDAAAYPAGATATISDAGDLTRTGFGFAGWNTAADGSGALYPIGSTVSIGPGDLTLFAAWRPDDALFTIAYDANGGTGEVPVDPVRYQPGDAAIVADRSALSRSGQAFDGWSTETDGGGATLQPGATLVVGTNSVTLYARWVPVYTVTYDANGGSGSVPIDADAYRTGATTNVASAAGLSRSPATFRTWTTARDGSGTAYAPGVPLTLIDGDVTLYAQWRVTPSLDANLIHVVALASDGSVFTWGSDERGMLGNRDTRSTLVAGRIVDLPEGLVVSVAAGDSSTYVLLDDGSVYAWGANDRGELGTGSIDAGTRTPQRVNGLEDVVAITAGSQYALALDADGAVWAWGRNDGG